MGDSKHLPWPALILAATAIAGGIFGFQSRLSSSRPPGPKVFDSPESGLEQIEARLWEDPLRAAFEHFGAQPATDKKEAEKNLRDLRKAIRDDLKSSERVIIMPAVISGAPYAESQERRRRNRYAVLSGLHEAGYSPVEGDRLGLVNLVDTKKQVIGITFEESLYPVPFERFENLTENRRVYVLWIADQLLTQRPVDDLNEIIDALDILKDPGEAEPGKEKKRELAGKISLAIIGPANSTTLGKMIAQAKDQKQKILTSYQVDRALMLSPWATASDDSLLSMAKGKNEIPEEKGKHEHSPEEDGDPDHAAPPEEDEDDHNPAEESGHDHAHGHAHGPGEKKSVLEEHIETTLGIDFHRTVHTDDHLMADLVDELRRRSIKLEKPANHVVLISEWDTAYGRGLPKSFAKAAPSSCLPENNNQIHTFAYQRGLDGVLPATGSSSVEKTSSEDGKEMVNWFDRSHQEKASGTSQFDYMRRLADQVADLDKRLRRENSGRVRAIGILGSDVYDKLIVLRALRKRFPGVVFFTTDLDAILFQRDEIEWTRNLIVLSSYGLRLHEKYQGDIPPFRNNYQTAIFASVLFALEKIDHGALTQMQAPRRFEISRSGAYDLSPKISGKQHRLLPERTDDWQIKQSRHLLVWVLLSTLPLFFLMRHIGKQFMGCKIVGAESGESLGSVTSPGAIYRDWALGIWSRLPRVSPPKSQIIYPSRNLEYIAKSSGWLILSLIFMLYVFVRTVISGFESGLGEPWSVFDGVSSWPSQIIRIAVFFFSFYFVTISCVGLEKNLINLRRRFHFARDNEDEMQEGREQAIPSQHKRILVMLAILICTAVLLFIMPYYEKPGLQTENVLLKFAGIALASVALFFALSGVVGRSKFERLREGEISEKNYPENSARLTWERHDQGNSYRWGLREVFCSSVAYFCFGMILIEQLGFPTRPIRGLISNLSDWFFLVCSLLGMLFLIFFVIWVSRRCIGLIDSLSQNETDWPQKVYDDFFNEQEALPPLGRGGCCDPLTEWFDIQFIADRTKVVGTVILYPFMIAFLQIFSRHHAIDDWHWSFGIVALFAVTLAIAVFFALNLRTTAERARKRALDNLEHKHLHALALASTSDPPVHINEAIQLISTLRERVVKIQRGAFAPITRHPVLMAILFPFGGLGSLAFIEYLVRAGG